ncbi:MAG: beta-propeller domain-containing protein, partial [Bdellovibrionales bacterium]
EQSRELIVVGQSEEFGRNEDIRSVRYIDDKVYVVTFERTDPLFVFDLSEPHEPQLLSELKVPGFSAYLHPVGAQRLAGVGYEAIDAGGFARLAGIQVSLFDSSNSAQIGVIEQKQFGGRGSFTDVAMDHHAYYYDPQTNLMGFPVRLMRSESNTEPVLEPSDFGFSGALLFDLAEGLAPVARLTHWEWLPSACRSQQLRGSQWNQASPSKDIRRLTQLGPQIATISPFGVKLHSRAPDFAVTISVRFRNVERECQ